MMESGEPLAGRRSDATSTFCDVAIVLDFENPFGTTIRTLVLPPLLVPPGGEVPPEQLARTAAVASRSARAPTSERSLATFEPLGLLHDGEPWLVFYPSTPEKLHPCQSQSW
jgi:hypothetical protein